jgi:hypothetical protein
VEILNAKNPQERSFIEEKIIDVQLEKSRLNREKSINLLNKGVLLYFSFTFLAIVGFINGYINHNFLNILITMGLCTLLIGTVPYLYNMRKEEKSLDNLYENLKKMERGEK